MDDCKTCRFMDRVSGECHRYPPIPLPIDGTVYHRLPKPGPTGWCGEYKERLLEGLKPTGVTIPGDDVVW